MESSIYSQINTAPVADIMHLYQRAKHEESWGNATLAYYLGENALAAFGEECYEECGCEFETIDREDVGYAVIDILKDKVAGL